MISPAHKQWWKFQIKNSTFWNHKNDCGTATFQYWDEGRLCRWDKMVQNEIDDNNDDDDHDNNNDISNTNDDNGNNNNNNKQISE